ncbi:MAG: DUF2934 domain-containing protein [Acidobacteriia bacterium]|nr:DUF2934 domain-containing protein [Terriglobia bacterium]
MKPSRMLDDRLSRTIVRTMGADDDLSAPAEADIARLAYSYWEARGEKGGSPWEDWFRAEQELLRRRDL